MEGYERRKLYRVHLKNISEIRNCRDSVSPTAYSSRLFNFSSKTTFWTRDTKSVAHNSIPPILSNKKKRQQKKIQDYETQKQNQRLEMRLLRASASIDMSKYQEEYREHKRLMKLHMKVKQLKRTILYKIYDITFKGYTPDLKEQFTIFDITEGKENKQQIMKGNIYELRKSIIKGFRDQKLIFLIVGRTCGKAMLVNGERMVSIMHNKQVVGTLIVETC